MKFTIKNSGPLKNCQIELGNLTVICGKNNTGKTYLSYSIFGFFEMVYNKIITYQFESFNFNDLRENIKKNGKYSIDLKKLENEIHDLYQSLSKRYIDELANIFNSNTDEFLHAKFTVKLQNRSNIKDLEFSFPISEDGKIVKEKNSEIANLYLSKTNKYVIEPIELNTENEKEYPVQVMFFAFCKGRLLLVFNELIQNIFLISAERTALQTFQKEIDQYRSRLIAEIQRNKSINFTEFYSSRFPYPLEQQMNFIRDTDKNVKKNSFIKDYHPDIIEYIENMLGVKYEFLNEQIMVNVGNKLIPQYLASSSVRSLADLHIWLKHKASKGDLLMIDEPELNLHPENQIKLARLFARLVNAGINIWITTHSDYIVKELNNLLLLSNEFADKDKFIKQFGYSKDEALSINQMKVYVSNENGTLENIKIDKHGMSSTTFDETIDKINEVSNSLFNLID